MNKIINGNSQAQRSSAPAFKLIIGITKLNMNGYIYPFAVSDDVVWMDDDNGVWYFK
jgi:hypothetical protein